MKTSILTVALLISLAVLNGQAQMTPEQTLPVIDAKSALNVRSDVERAMWVWNTENIVYSVGTAKQDFFAFCENHKGTGDYSAPLFTQHPYNRVFFYAHGFLVSGQEEKDSLRSFLREAHARGIAVDYLDGDPSWINTGASDANTVISDLLAFNAGGTSDEQFDGVMLDIEPWTLRGWYSQSLWSDYTNFLKGVRSKIFASRENLRFGLAIPRWYDVSLGMDAVKQIYSIVNAVTVMDYVNDSHRLVEEVSNEIALGDEMNVKVYVGVETDQNFISTVSYKNLGWMQMENDLAVVNKAYTFDKAYAGVAVSNYASYTGMRRTPRSLEYTTMMAEAAVANAPELRGSTAEVVMIDSPASHESKKAESEIKALRVSNSALQTVVAEMPLVMTPQVYNQAEMYRVAESAYVKGGGVQSTVSYFNPLWSDELPRAIKANAAQCIKEGFDGVVVDLNAAYAMALQYEVPDAANKVVDLLNDMSKTLRVNAKDQNAVIIARNDNAFINRLDDAHYREYMALIDGVMLTDGSANASAYAHYGVKVMSSTKVDKSLMADASLAVDQAK
ncbi:MAG TPA: hypothetical protein VFA55_03025 [Candidatus Kapabacteria bacterium]|nr:hypothetical protein [Candidatus Kapabacteria bacterium]